MIGAFVLAALFASVVVLYVVFGARRNRARAMDRTSASAALFADRRQELVAEGRVQALDTPTLAELEEELALDLIESEGPETDSPSGSLQPPLRIVALTGAGLAVVALGLYAIWGEPHASALVRAGDVLVSDGVDRAALASAEKALSARAGRNPEDVDTWFFLGHSRMRLSDYRGAEIAFAKLRDLAGPNEEADAAWAQASYLAERGLTDRTRQVVERVLAARPAHPAMLEMLAMDAMRRSAFAEASGYLARATGQPLPESRRALLEDLMTVARSQLDPARPLIEVSVNVEGETRRPWLFVFARPVGGGMPLAAVRVRARASQTVLLDDSVGMGGATRLSDGGLVEVVARLSDTGNAAASADDVEVSARPVDPGTQPHVELTFSSDAVPGSATATVDVSLDAAFDVAPAAIVFVIARDAEQPGPPLVVKRITAGDLPARIALTDADAMLAGRGLQGVETLALVARVALGGSTTAMAGDLESPIWVGSLSAEPVHLHIDRRRP
ncbi:MAG: c-type cytochrome biogenesis protein CcmI [Gammaproteobacteria bacterium]|nr:c-type cytochrome biogenesis protein CcmI [Gammaproteobacteria bacterium]